jgi:putative membrane protein
MQQRTIKDYLLISLKGIGMGAADVVPGVSGGTIAFITGIYEELINSIKSVNFKTLKLLFTGKLRAFWQGINGNFLLALVSGIFISVLSLAKLLQYLLEHQPVLIWSFFFGLIVASSVFVAKKVHHWNVSTILPMLAGGIIAYYITIVSPAEAHISYPFIFLSGAIAICAMILPGISGSFILLLMGMYKFILDSVTNLRILVVLTFLSGAAIGLVLFSNFLSWLLRKYHSQTVAMLTGFMVGSLNKVWPWKEVTKTFTDRHGVVKTLEEISVLPGRYEQVTGNEAYLGWAIALAVVGFVLIWFVEKITSQQDSETV